MGHAPLLVTAGTAPAFAEVSANQQGRPYSDECCTVATGKAPGPFGRIPIVWMGHAPLLVMTGRDVSHHYQSFKEQ
jgi:hypothetical protein